MGWTAKQTLEELEKLEKKGKAELFWEVSEPVDARELLEILIPYFEGLAEKERGNDA